MSSANEELSAPPKHRLSPFEVRNTDLVSRLLAATPPYLYNMPLVPHSYFFSEMLRSLVQSKADAAARMTNNVPHRRARKRTWAQGRAEHYKQEAAKNDSQEMPPPTWTPPKLPVDRRGYETKGLLERPLELTMHKLPLNNNNVNKITHTDTQSNETATSRSNEYKPIHSSPTSTITSSEKTEMHVNNQMSMMFPPLPNLTPPDNHSPSSSSSSTDLILPPPPPIWYPPIYPPPYGIDPLHFFIDLRVSGHIYDRKNQNKDHPNFNIPQSNPQMPAMNPSGINNILEMNNLPAVPNIIPTSSSSSSSSSISDMSNYSSLTRESRHTSAFSVPTPSLNLNDPLNLTSKYQKNPRYEKNDRKGKFDIKSMGFDSSENKQSSNYILKNLDRIYRDVNETKYHHEGIDLTSPRHEENDADVSVKEEEGKHEDEKDSDKEKKCKDLRALIGLELVVDYVNHNVKPKNSLSEESSTDIDSRCSSTSAVEIVTVPDI